MGKFDFSSFLPELIKIRHQLHAMPEIGLSEFKTSEFIAQHLTKWGFEVTRGLGQTGVVGSLKRGDSNRSIGFRADFDALPILEETGLPYASKHEGVMHACGHDGHTAMLLGAAYALSQDQDFNGAVHMIFQPAEENFGGGKMMIEDGLFERFPCEQVFAIHNMPGLATGVFSAKAGAMAASIDVLTLTVKGSGGHGAMPELTVDPVVVASSIVMALQTLVSRNISPHQPAVLTVGSFQSGSACNIIPDTAVLELSMRAMDPSVRVALRDRVDEIARFQAKSYQAEVQLDWAVGYPATINNKQAYELARDVAVASFGEDAFEELDVPMMGSEDFSFLLEAVPGAYIFLGNGDSSGLHTSRYNFNDEILERGASFFHQMAKSSLV
ncbi:M20 aminoacylase family protein [Pseudochrobactrum sp. XF203]|uniref:M20 aminoacylase family protein n=1 Tax=Pseudochrobactrum sp. XF203 TaxID=2879116 RepID=UPI001CE2C553|nr:M20 aminoacylase family protein [Pseudochrobactrum sp. XF203]UCA45447.1 M20 family metallopeptidase [Pseudochrobactrum sp. XF203]